MACLSGSKPHMPLTQYTESPRYLRLHEADNVAVIVNDGGVSAASRK